MSAEDYQRIRQALNSDDDGGDGMASGVDGGSLISLLVQTTTILCKNGAAAQNLRAAFQDLHEKSTAFQSKIDTFIERCNALLESPAEEQPRLLKELYASIQAAWKNISDWVQNVTYVAETRGTTCPPCPGKPSECKMYIVDSLKQELMLSKAAVEKVREELVMGLRGRAEAVVTNARRAATLCLALAFSDIKTVWDSLNRNRAKLLQFQRRLDDICPRVDEVKCRLNAILKHAEKGDIPCQLQLSGLNIKIVGLERDLRTIVADLEQKKDAAERSRNGGVFGFTVAVLRTANAFKDARALEGLISTAAAWWPFYLEAGSVVAQGVVTYTAHVDVQQLREPLARAKLSYTDCAKCIEAIQAMNILWDL